MRTAQLQNYSITASLHIIAATVYTVCVVRSEYFCNYASAGAFFNSSMCTPISLLICVTIQCSQSFMLYRSSLNIAAKQATANITRYLARANTFY